MQHPKLKGGRGKRAPYNATHARIPEPIKELVSKLSDGYRASLFDGTTDELLERVKAAIEVKVSPRTEASYEEVRDRVLADVRSDKLKAVKTALDKFISEISA